MLNEHEQLFATLSKDQVKVSEPINIQNAGMKGKITLNRGEFEELEFMYST